MELEERNVPLAAIFKIDTQDSQHDGAGFRYTAMLFLEAIIACAELEKKLEIYLAGGRPVHETDRRCCHPST